MSEYVFCVEDEKAIAMMIADVVAADEGAAMTKPNPRAGTPKTRKQPACSAAKRGARR